MRKYQKRNELWHGEEARAIALALPSPRGRGVAGDGRGCRENDGDCQRDKPGLRGHGRYLAHKGNGFRHMSGTFANIKIRNNIIQTQNSLNLVNFSEAGWATFQGNSYWPSGDTFKIKWGSTTYNSLKYAGIFTGADEWRIGQVASGTQTILTSSSQTLSENTDYSMELEVHGSDVTLKAGGVTKVSHQFGGDVNDGLLGVGVDHGQSVFDNIVITGL
jgi:hypothetical protein